MSDKVKEQDEQTKEGLKRLKEYNSVKNYFARKKREQKGYE